MNQALKESDDQAVEDFAADSEDSVDAESRAPALGLDVDIKFGAAHLHFKWSAIPLTPATTKSPGTLF